MRNIIIASVMASAALGLSVTQSTAGSYGHGGNLHQIQYGGGGGYSGGGHHQNNCYWERKQVRSWDSYYKRWNTAWQQVRVCR